ncbi:MAG: hypothetical protein AUK63_2487 [bacterium P3]|nr:MAG: hypothetical protein AUK63_2487 [bacterium P3]
MDLVNIVKEENEKNRDCLTTSQLGRPLGLTAREVYEKLCSLGVLYYSHHRYMLTKAYCYRGLMMYRNFVYFSKEGERKLRRYPVWTPSGVESLRKLIAKEMK